MTAAVSPELSKELDKLRKALQKNDVVPVVGPGLSSPPLPDWKTLLHEIASKAPTALRARIEGDLEKEDLKAAVSAIEEQGPALVAEAVARHRREPRHDRPAVFASLAALPVPHFVV